jgi:hypothetical protein
MRLYEDGKGPWFAIGILAVVLPIANALFADTLDAADIMARVTMVVFGVCLLVNSFPKASR